MTSASPRWMARNASPTAMAPEAQLIPLVMLGPVMPSSMARLQLEAPTKTVRASPGSTQRIPPARYFSCSRSANSTPPRALPIIAPIRSRSSPASSMPPSASASRAAASVNWEQRSSRFARRGSSQSVGSKPSTSAATWLRKGAGSNRVTVRTTDRAARRPSQKALTPMPIGVTGPTPVITTRRSVMSGLRRAADAREGASGDAMHEYRPDDPRRRRPPDERPGGAGPLVHDRGAGAGPLRHDAPEHVHPRGDAANVPIAHLAALRRDPHLRQPPGGPLERTERAPGGHLHQPPAAGALLAKPHPAVVGKDLGPALHLARAAEDAIGRRRHPEGIHGAHQAAVSQPATSRAPGRRITCARMPAWASRAAGEVVRTPRRSEVSPSLQVLGSKPSARLATRHPSSANGERRRSATITARRATRSHSRKSRMMSAGAK